MQQHIGNSIGGSPHECPLDAFRSCLLGRLTGKPEVDKLAWRHLTLICNSPDLTLHTWLSETVGTVYCCVRPCESSRCSEASTFATLFGHAQAPFVLCCAIRRPSPSQLTKP